MKSALVIGSEGGIGRELVKALKSNSYEVLEVSRNNSIKCDLTNFDQIDQAISEIKSKLKSLDLLVYVAGVATYKNIADVKNSEIQEAFMVNAIAPAIFIRELSPIMNHQNSLILLLGSGAGTMPMRGRSIYCATKYALRGLSLSLSEEFKDKNPKFCLITLGSTLTDFGGKPVAEKQAEYKQGRAYFPVEFVINKLMETISDNNRPDEIVLYPGDYGFGSWKKP